MYTIDEIESKKNGYKLFNILVLTVGIFFIIMIVFYNILYNYYVENHIATIRVTDHSMEPTLMDGDEIRVTDIFSVKRGDIVVIDLGRGEFYVKTVIAIEGDTVELVETGSENRIVLTKKNGKQKVISRDFTGPFEYQGAKTKVLEKDEFFVVGENISHSFDSTEKDFGIIKKDNIKYKAIDIKTRFYLD